MAKTLVISSIEGGRIRKAIEVPDGKYKIEVSPLNQRSLAQNSYLHAALIPEFRKALNGAGYDEVKTDAQAKLIIKSMFLTASVYSEIQKMEINYVRRTRDLNKDELNTLIDEVIKFTAENLNHQIAYPNEQLMMQYE